MIQAIIIEDERAIQEELRFILSEVEPAVSVKATISSVRDGIKYLSDQPEADIIFSDIQLEDGLSFEIFQATNIKIPVIFITGFDTFLMNAFEYNGIDYLLKPVDKDDLSKALLKYKT